MGVSISIENLCFGWTKDPLLKIPSLKIPEGEKVFLQGVSGSGKSTFLNLLSGVLGPWSGDISIGSVSLTQMSPSERDIFRGEHMGFIFQMFNLIPYLSVFHNVLLPCQFSKKRLQKVLRKGSLEEEASSILKALGLTSELFSQKITALSVGQQQRVAAARALIGAPDLILADEPTSSLDSENQKLFLKLLFEQCEKQNSSLVFVSHDERLAQGFHQILNLKDLNKVKVS